MKTQAQETVFHKNTVGASIATNGVGICAGTHLGQSKSGFQNKFHINFQTIRHPSQTKVQNEAFTNPKPYIYGKLNAGGTLRICHGLSKSISAKKPNKPTISLEVKSGLNIGTLKPYYVRYSDHANTENRIIVTQQNELTMSNQDAIYGPASWTRGFNELRTSLGIHAAVQLNIEWNHSYYFRDWDTGVSLDYFPAGYKLLHQFDNQTFIGIYTAYSFGKN